MLRRFLSLFDSLHACSAALAFAFLATACGGLGTPRSLPSPCAQEQHRGEATYYDPNRMGNCGYPVDEQGWAVAAINSAEYAGSAACGACARVRGPKGELTVRIIDRCPGCKVGDLDLSRPAFSAIADLRAGRVPLTWAFVPCEVQGNIRYHFKEGSNRYWTAVQIREHRLPIASVEARNSQGNWVELTRKNYNYFVRSGLGAGPYTFRVRDVEGGVVEDEGLAFQEGAEMEGRAQFSGCRP